MVWIGILGIILYITGIIIRDAHMSPETVWVPMGKVIAGIGLALFAFLLLVSLIGGIQSL